MPEWLMGTDCKSVGSDLRWFKSSSAQKIIYDYSMRSHSFMRVASFILIEAAHTAYKTKDNNSYLLVYAFCILCFLYPMLFVSLKRKKNKKILKAYCFFQIRDLLRKDKSCYLLFYMRSFQCPMRSQYPLLSIQKLTLFFSKPSFQLKYSIKAAPAVCVAKDTGCAQDTKSIESGLIKDFNRKNKNLLNSEILKAYFCFVFKASIFCFVSYAFYVPYLLGLFLTSLYPNLFVSLKRKR